MWTTTLKPVEVKSFNSLIGPTTAIPESPMNILPSSYLLHLLQIASQAPLPVWAGQVGMIMASFAVRVEAMERVEAAVVKLLRV